MIINMTPHSVVLIRPEGKIIFPSMGVARREQHQEVVSFVEGVPVKRTHYGEITGLPEEKAGTYFIVSAVCAKNANRNDLLVPSDSVRDEKGRIIGCECFATLRES